MGGRKAVMLKVGSRGMVAKQTGVWVWALTVTSHETLDLLLHLLGSKFSH